MKKYLKKYIMYLNNLINIWQKNKKEQIKQKNILKKDFFFKKKWTRAYGVVFKATDIRQKKLLFKKITLSFSR